MPEKQREKPRKESPATVKGGTKREETKDRFHLQNLFSHFSHRSAANVEDRVPRNGNGKIFKSVEAHSTEQTHIQTHRLNCAEKKDS